MACQETEKIVLWLGESLGFWIQTGAFIFTAVGAIAVIYNNSHQAKKRATIDLVLHENQNQKLIEAKNQVTKFHKEKKNFTEMACCDDFEENPDNDHILLVLNNYEFTAAGIKEGAFDEEIYKRMKRSLVIREWDAFSAYIAELRRKTGRDKIYAEFEWLANRWRNNHIKPEVSWWRRLFTWAGL